ncbi:hypothetical protein ACFRMO_05255 [Streptomyces anulatus]|uniref:hypothetical protein n=1 Tax=Streptomyces TaxID=1883 RepID=UPI000AB49D44|nr:MULTISPECIES: hypothetical protein [Streptomyces]MDF9801811.1 hypothetical protein [Streptomyces sp. HB372]WTC67826.1 hypothetical protein OG865_37050 [Streptomyces anulatus]GGY74345.1 hypothetical protein GCM10010342_72810 [Streptomyces anulatus]
MTDPQTAPDNGPKQPAEDSATPPMPDIPPATEPVAAPAVSTKTSWRRTLATLLVGAAAGAAIVGGTWYTTSSNGGDSSNDKAATGSPAADTVNTEAEADGTFTLEGEFTLTEEAVSDGIGGCEGSGGYSDIQLGTSVTVYDAAGTVIATSALILSEFDEAAGSCTYDVSVEDVPAGEDFYQVEVSHRGKLHLPAEEAKSGSFSGSLGD